MPGPAVRSSTAASAPASECRTHEYEHGGWPSVSSPTRSDVHDGELFGNCCGRALYGPCDRFQPTARDARSQRRNTDSRHDTASCVADGGGDAQNLLVELPWDTATSCLRIWAQRACSSAGSVIVLAVKRSNGAAARTVATSSGGAQARSTSAAHDHVRMTAARYEPLPRGQGTRQNAPSAG
jgi:hypothetical protein